jgi:hypothetical protein
MDVLLTMTGTSPLLMHSSRLSDPLDPHAKALKKVSGKRSKTDEDFEQMGRVEFAGGLYFSDPEGPFMPGDNITACIIAGARLNRLGKQIERGFVVTGDINPLIYKGPRDVEALYADANFRSRQSVKVGTSRVVRTRPMFRNWACETTAILDTQQLDLEDLRAIVERAGAMIGLGDWRPRYGRFTATVEES